MFLVNVSYIVILLLAAYRDYKTYTVSRYTNLGIFLLSLMDITRFPLHLGGAFLITLPFLYIGVKKDQIGGGDIKFIFVNGCFLGLEDNYTGIFIGFVLVAIVDRIRKLRRKSNRKIALVPYLVAGYLVAMLM